MLIVTQFFAIAFNVGLLASMLLVHLPFEELRFGWQSTYSFTADGVAAFVQATSAPWRWIAQGLAPDAAQIAATRYARGQLATAVPADAGHAWWPYLLCAIAFYGLLLRASLAAAAAGLLRRRLDQLTFASPAANALWRRLRGPLVAATGDDPSLSDASAAPVARSAVGVDVLVVDDELAAAAQAVVVAAGRVFGEPVRRTVTANVDDDGLGTALPALRQPADRAIVVATPAARDPIVAIAGFLCALRDHGGPDAELTLLLLGEPAPDRAGFAAPSAARVAIWRRFVAIHRLDVGVEAAG